MKKNHYYQIPYFGFFWGGWSYFWLRFYKSGWDGWDGWVNGDTWFTVTYNKGKWEYESGTEDSET